jgi:hypothetical protein
MLDAIASAPFLVAAQAAALAPEEPVASEPDFADEPQPVAAVAEFEPVAEDSVNGEEPENTQPEESDHEIAASAPEPVWEAKSEPVPEALAVEPQQAEAKRHSIHGAPEEEPKEPSAPRRMGWWSKRKTG